MHNKKIYLSLVFLLIFHCIGYGYTKLYGKASWYSTQSCIKEGTSGIFTASGEKFNENNLTCAIRSYDFGGIYRVCNLQNNKCVEVKHNDFGPGKKMARKGRVIDLSKRAFSVIANLKDGVVGVTVERIK